MRRKRRDTIEPRESLAAVDGKKSNGQIHKEAEKRIDRWKDKMRRWRRDSRRGKPYAHCVQTERLAHGAKMDD